MASHGESIPEGLVGPISEPFGLAIQELVGEPPLTLAPLIADKGSLR